MSRSVLSERPSSAPSSSVYRVATDWGFTLIEHRDGTVVSITPPGEHVDASRAVDATSNVAPKDVRELGAAMEAYFAGEAVDLASREQVGRWLDALGITGARRAMSLALFDVPRGVTLSYGELAALAGYPGAARASGSMCARNPLPVIIPCHRVVHAGARRGDVGTYGAATGSEYKRRLLELEDAALVRPA